MNSFYTIALIISVIVFYTNILTVSAKPPSDPTKCNRLSVEFASRHGMQIGTEQAQRDQGNLWKQHVAVIAPVDLGTGVPQWFEVASFDFWQDNLWAGEELCCWNETQAWPRSDPNTGEFVLALQRVFICPQDSYYKRNFDVVPPAWDESQSEYSVEWYKDAILEESAIVMNTVPVEYALGDKVLSSGWYKADGSLPSVNTLINYVDGYYRTYSLNTILEAVPGDSSTSYKILADITSTSELPPSIVSQAFEWFDEKIDDPNYVPVVNPNTGIGEYVFVPSQHATRQARESISTSTINTNPSVNINSHESIQKLINSHEKK